MKKAIFILIITLLFAYRIECSLQEIIDHYNQGNYKKAEEIAKNLPDGFTKFNSLGRIYHITAEFKKANHYFNLALDNAKTQRQNMIACLNYGSLFDDMDQMKYAIKFTELSLDLARELKDTSTIFMSLNNLGCYYYTEGNTEKAEFLNKKALALADSELNKSIILNNIGLFLEKKGEITKALDYYRRSLEYSKKTGDVNSISKAYSNIGILYLRQDKMKKALIYMDSAVVDIHGSLQHLYLQDYYSELYEYQIRQKQKEKRYVIIISISLTSVLVLIIYIQYRKYKQKRNENMNKRR